MKQNIFRKLMLIAVLLTCSHAFCLDNCREITYKGKTIYYRTPYNQFYNKETVPITVVPYKGKSDDWGYYNGIEYTGVIEIPDEFYYTYSQGGLYYVKFQFRYIGEKAFSDCKNLISVILPNTVESIYDSAFSGCSGMTSITLSNSLIGIGVNAFKNCNNLTSITIPNSVVSIGNGAFSGCSGLTSITIPNFVTSIGEGVFSGCTNLTFVTIPNSVTYIHENAFYNCENLTEIYCKTINPPTCKANSDGLYSMFSDNVLQYATLYVPIGSKSAYESTVPWCQFVNIQESDFSSEETMYVIIAKYNSNLGSVTINGVSDTRFKVNENEKVVFEIKPASGCEIDKVTCNGIDVSNNIVDGKYTIEKVTENISLDVTFKKKLEFGHKFEVDGIYYSVISDTNKTVEVTFKGNTAVEYSNEYKGDVIVPETVFYNNITFSIIGIGAEAFYNCGNKLTSITLPNSIKYVGNKAFSCCHKLTSVAIGDSVESIGDEAFYYDEKLTSITIPNSVKHIGNEAFSYCKGITSVVLGNSVISIGEGAFENCSGLTSITIPNSVKNIGKNTFTFCSNLTSIIIGNSVESIEKETFYGCYSLISITIGNSVSFIGESALSDCSNLVEIYCNATIPPNCLGSYPFSSKAVQYATLYVPTGYKSAYSSAEPWSKFKIQEYEFSSIESTLADDVNVSIENGSIIVSGADNAKVEVYSVNGQCVYRGNATTIPVTAKGLYIVNINNKSYKVIL